MNESTRVIGSTYRLQFSREFTFRDALAVVHYLHQLGVTHLYASPVFRARSGSTHGYDIVDFSQFNPEIGTDEDFSRLALALREHQIGLILDIVPNHMAVGTGENIWWNSVLAEGEHSEFADFFDIQWTDFQDYGGRRAVFLPILGEPVSEALKKNAISLCLDNRGLGLCYHNRRLPLSKASEVSVCREVAAQLSADPSKSGELKDSLRRYLEHGQDSEAVVETIDAREFYSILASSGMADSDIDAEFAHWNAPPALQDILFQQFYVLGYWADDVQYGNYRRFFDVSDLAGLNSSRPDVFEAIHGKVFSLLDAGLVQGLRVDHPDGLSDPRSYFLLLRAEAAKRLLPEHRLYIVAEKILAVGEELEADWHSDGTTGYDFLAMVNGYFVDQRSASTMDRIWTERSETKRSYSDEVFEKKSKALEILFRSDFKRLVSLLVRLAESEGLNRERLQTALGTLIAAFPVYRTYVSGTRISGQDSHHVTKARIEADRRIPGYSVELSFIEAAIRATHATMKDSVRVEFVTRFQQLTAPVTAKGVEDTAFYTYNRLISLNEVGGDPAVYGFSKSDLHTFFAKRSQEWPLAMSASSTHDTKRSEDSRARIGVLSECAAQWEEKLRAWEAVNYKFKTNVDGQMMPESSTEYFLYQSLIGAWPQTMSSFDRFVDRTVAFMEKAIREAKTHTSWRNPSLEYEQAVKQFVRRILNQSGNKAFVSDFGAFHRSIDVYGMLNSLSAVVIKYTAPGVPDTYQGTEVWNYSYVDPDNRRPVDFSRLDKISRSFARSTGSQHQFVRNSLMGLLGGTEDGSLKLFITRSLLQLRRSTPELFLDGAYRPVHVSGTGTEHLFAFARTSSERCLMVIVPRHLYTFFQVTGSILGDAWNDTEVHQDLFSSSQASVRNILTGEEFRCEQQIRCKELFRHFPFAVIANF